jgi:hypothetical protein
MEVLYMASCVRLVLMPERSLLTDAALTMLLGVGESSLILSKSSFFTFSFTLNLVSDLSGVTRSTIFDGGNAASPADISEDNIVRSMTSGWEDLAGCGGFGRFGGSGEGVSEERSRRCRKLADGFKLGRA